MVQELSWAMLLPCAVARGYSRCASAQDNGALALVYATTGTWHAVDTEFMWPVMLFCAVSPQGVLQAGAHICRAGRFVDGSMLYE